MNASASPADALVADIDAKVAAERRRLLDAAAHEAAELRARAHDKARRQQRRAIDELRALGRQRLQSQAAQCETARRQQATARAQTMLAAAWPLLREAIDHRWQDPAARERWLRALLAMARARCHGTPLRVRHPADLTSLQAALQMAGLADAMLEADAALDAGLVIESDGARLDGTPRALLADRARVEAAVLAALAAAPEAGGE